MKRALVALVALVAVAGLACGASAQAGPKWQKPTFCRTLDCPVYTVSKTLPGGIELRTYQPSSWTSVDSYNMSMDNSKGFFTLFNYIEGANAKQQKIAMTAPVLTRITPGAGPACKSNFTMSFYLPYTLQGASDGGVPRPTAAGTYTQRMPALKVYVLPFGGMADQAAYRAKAGELMKTLRAAGVKFDAGQWFTAGYNSPFDVIDRHNEVWVKAL